MALTPSGMTPCPGGDCHGIDHAWCAPGRHVLSFGRHRGRYDRRADLLASLMMHNQGRHKAPADG